MVLQNTIVSVLKILSSVLILWAFLFCACSKNTVESGGGGSETVVVVSESKAITGTVTTVDGKSVERYFISLYKNNYSPLISLTADNYSDTAYPSLNGAFSFSNLDTGLYNLIVYDTGCQQAVIINNIQVAQDAMYNYQDTLSGTGNLQMVVVGGNSVIVYLQGTPYFSIRDVQNHCNFSSLPAGNFSAKIIKHENTTVDTISANVDSIDVVVVGAKTGIY